MNITLIAAFGTGSLIGAIVMAALVAGTLSMLVRALEDARLEAQCLRESRDAWEDHAMSLRKALKRYEERPAA